MFVVPVAVRLSVFSFPDDNLGVCQLIFTKRDICINIVDIWFGIAIWYISSIFDRIISHDKIMAR